MIDDEPDFGMTIAGDRDFDELRAASDHERMALVELVNRVLDKGVVVTGEVTISIAGVDLLFVGLQLILSSVDTLVRDERIRAHKLAPPSRGQP